MNEQDITAEWVVERLGKYQQTVEWCILALYDQQTATEQEARTTAYHNGVGYSAVDADLGSSFAEQIIRKRNRGIKAGQCLTPKQVIYARKMLPKYRKQLVQYMRASIREANRQKEAQHV